MSNSTWSAKQRFTAPQSRWSVATNSSVMTSTISCRAARVSRAVSISRAYFTRRVGKICWARSVSGPGHDREETDLKESGQRPAVLEMKRVLPGHGPHQRIRSDRGDRRVAAKHVARTVDVSAHEAARRGGVSVQRDARGRGVGPSARNGEVVVIYLAGGPLRPGDRRWDTLGRGLRDDRIA